MNLELDKAVKFQLKTIKNFSKKNNQSTQGVYYALQNNLIDYCIIDGIKFIVGTPKTVIYKPRKDIKRIENVNPIQSK